MSSGDIEQVAQLFVRLGATAESAEVMARQLLKRADQIAVERGIARVEALDSLLRSAIRGREGLPPSDLPTFGTPEDRD